MKQKLYDINEIFIKTLSKGHHFTAGEKVQLSVKEVKRFSFDSIYGTTFVIMYATKCGKLVKYMGSNPSDKMDDWTYITATIKHDFYKEDETKLLRIKINNSRKSKLENIVD
jgi:hypothetical protein